MLSHCFSCSLAAILNVVSLFQLRVICRSSSTLLHCWCRLDLCHYERPLMDWSSTSSTLCAPVPNSTSVVSVVSHSGDSCCHSNFVQWGRQGAAGKMDRESEFHIECSQTSKLQCQFQGGIKDTPFICACL